MKPEVKRILFLSLFLAVLGLVCSGMLAVVNYVTEPIIEANKMKELEKQLAIINIKEPSIVECQLADGVDAVYSGIYNKGEIDETECYVFQVTVKNDYTKITSIIAIGKKSGKIVALSPMSGDPSYTTHGKNGDFEGNQFGLIGKGENNYSSAFENVAGATKSSESIKKGVQLAYEQYKILLSKPVVNPDRKYISDGTFMSYKLSVNNGAPEVIYATVTIRNDQLTNIEIDTIQSTINEGVVSYNEKTKAELGYTYHMHWWTYLSEVGNGNESEEGYIEWLKTNNKLEWFEQINILEDYLLLNGTDQVVINDSKYENISGVSITDYGYVELVAEALNNAKNGVLKAFTASGAGVIMTQANVDKNGNLTNVILDVKEGVINNDSGQFVWNEKSKNELGYGYKMHFYNYAPTVGYENATEQGYIDWLKTNNKLEWFEQAELIAKAWELDNNLTSSDGSFDSIASVTISDALYINTLNKLKTYRYYTSMFKSDGTYLAYSLNTKTSSPELIYVTVTIKNDTIVDIEIDTIQGTNENGVASFYSQSKRELGYGYKLHYYTYAGIVGYDKATEEGYVGWLRANNKYEWFEQMDLLEEYILKNGVESVILNQNNKYESISGVSVSDYGYIELVKEAIEYAKEGFVQSFTVVGDDVVISSANIDEQGNLTNVVLDTIEGNVNKDTGEFSWNSLTKNEQKYSYHMHWWTYLGEVGYENGTEEGYIEWLKRNSKLEWFEQAELIAKAWEKDHTLSTNNGKFDTISSVTISDGSYLDTLNKLIEEE